MSAMKRRLENMIENLSKKSGYSTEFLYDMYFRLQDEFAAAGEAFDTDQFIGITLDRDW